jgi:hypothetical protein
MTPTDESGSTSEEYADNIVDLECHIQSLDESFTEDLDGSFGKDSLMFCAISDILEGDRIIDGSDYYRVVGMKIFDFGSINDHMELRIRMFNP